MEVRNFLLKMLKFLKIDPKINMVICRVTVELKTIKKTCWLNCLFQKLKGLDLNLKLYLIKVLYYYIYRYW
jgi:hypothetical protein